MTQTIRKRIVKEMSKASKAKNSPKKKSPKKSKSKKSPLKASNSKRPCKALVAAGKSAVKKGSGKKVKYAKKLSTAVKKAAMYLNAKLSQGKRIKARKLSARK
jgi:hypothetical protein